MPEKPKVIAEFKECPLCHHPGTIGQLADKPLKEAGRVPKDKFSSLSKELIALTDPRVALSVETLIMHYDVCAKCGHTYTVRAETTVGVVKMVPRPKGS